MRPQPDLTMKINVSGRVLAAIGVAGLLVVHLFSVTGAQSSQSPDVNGVSVDSASTLPPPTPIPFADPPEGFVWTANGDLISVEALGTGPVGLESANGVFATAGGGSGVYYLTNANYSSNQALVACASGYHMASLWEIIDPSNLTYDFNHPAAHTKADSGAGPPSLWYGRVRTGADSSGSASAGTGNCNNWTSTSAADYGVFVRLSRTWETPPAEIGGIWEVTAFACSITGPVWCAGEFFLVYLPIVVKQP